jgi:hypothetical protein
VQLGERRRPAAGVGEARGHGDVVGVAIREEGRRVGDDVVDLSVEDRDEEVPRVREEEARRELVPPCEDLAPFGRRAARGVEVVGERRRPELPLEGVGRAGGVDEARESGRD